MASKQTLPLQNMKLGNGDVGSQRFKVSSSKHIGTFFESWKKPDTAREWVAAVVNIAIVSLCLWMFYPVYMQTRYWHDVAKGFEYDKETKTFAAISDTALTNNMAKIANGVEYEEEWVLLSSFGDILMWQTIFNFLVVTFVVHHSMLLSNN